MINSAFEGAGISDVWVGACILLGLLDILFLIGWVTASRKARMSRRELKLAREELIGTRALLDLPPLHEGDYSFIQETRPDTFPKCSEDTMPLYRLRESRPERETTGVVSIASEHETGASSNVALQVHEAIYASITEDKRCLGSSVVSDDDLPSMHLADTPGKSADTAMNPGTGNVSDASLSKRIPRI